MNKVELHPASVWTCDECGRDNFLRTIVMEGGDDCIIEGQDGEEDIEAVFIIEPSHVTCPHCNIEFEVNSCEEDCE